MVESHGRLGLFVFVNGFASLVFLVLCVGGLDGGGPSPRRFAPTYPPTNPPAQPPSQPASHSTPPTHQHTTKNVRVSWGAGGGACLGLSVLAWACRGPSGRRGDPNKWSHGEPRCYIGWGWVEVLGTGKWWVLDLSQIYLDLPEPGPDLPGPGPDLPGRWKDPGPAGSPCLWLPGQTSRAPELIKTIP